MNLTKRANGVDLHDEARGWSLQASSTVRSAVEAVTPTMDVPRHHGVRLTGLPPRQGAISERLDWLLQVDNDSESQLEACRDDLLALLRNPGLLLQHEVADAVVVEASAYLLNAPEVADHVVGRHMRLQAIVRVPGGLWRSPGYVESGALAAGSHAVSAWSGTGPIPDAVVRFPGSVTSVSVTDTAYGQGISWAGSSGGTYLYLDPINWRAWKHSSSSAWAGGVGGTDVTAGLSAPAAGRLELWPIASVGAPGGGGEAVIPLTIPFTIGSGGVTPGPVERVRNLVVTGGTATIRAKDSWL